jgi:cysteine-rich repeat protein
MISLWKQRFGAIVLSTGLLVGCGGAVCGDGVPDAGEQCDDTNNTDGDGCSAVCTFEAPKTDFRISQLSLDDGRFNATNLLLATAVNNEDAAKALNVLIQFDNTENAAATATFGPGIFDEGAETFSFDNVFAPPAVIAITNTDGTISFDAPIDLVLPLEVEVGTGVFQPLNIKQANVTATFGKEQLGVDGEGGLFIDTLEDGSISSKVDVFELCSLNLILARDQDGNIALETNLLDVFDDGTPANNSSLFPPAGTAPDANNCVPCGGAGAAANCVQPEDAVNNQYVVEASFEAEGGVTIVAP